MRNWKNLVLFSYKILKSIQLDLALSMMWCDGVLMFVQLTHLQWSRGEQSFNNNNNHRFERCSSRFSIISSLRHELFPTCTLKWPGHNRVQVTCNTSNAYHVPFATWYEGTALQSLNRIYTSFILLAEMIKLTNKGGEKTEYPEKTLDNEFQTMSHTKASRFKPQPKHKPALWHWWQARKADVLTITTRVAPFPWF